MLFYINKKLKLINNIITCDENETQTRRSTVQPFVQIIVIIIMDGSFVEFYIRLATIMLSFSIVR